MTCVVCSGDVSRSIYVGRWSRSEDFNAWVMSFRKLVKHSGNTANGENSTIPFFNEDSFLRAPEPGHGQIWKSRIFRLL